MNREEALKKSHETNEIEFQKAIDKIRKASEHGLTHTDIGEASHYTTSKLRELGYDVKLISYMPPEEMDTLMFKGGSPMLEEMHYLVMWFEVQKEQTIPSKMYMLPFNGLHDLHSMHQQIMKAHRLNDQQIIVKLIENSIPYEQNDTIGLCIDLKSVPGQNYLDDLLKEERLSLEKEYKKLGIIRNTRNQ